ncbi:hypothetical protein MKC61_07300, partial [[Clostridium] innocuum]|nr:hypothetical protein [[Clostridium] innocuum]
MIYDIYCDVRKSSCVRFMNDIHILPCLVKYENDYRRVSKIFGGLNFRGQFRGLNFEGHFRGINPKRNRWHSSVSFSI